MPDQAQLRLLPGRPEMLRAVQAHDAAYEGVFFMAVRTTGVFCRPTCRPPRAPKPENLEFFGTARECLAAGYRPCKLCRPGETRGDPPQDIAALIRRVEAGPDTRFTASQLRELGASPERVRRWFQEHHGLTFAAWCRTRRMADALQALQGGARLDDVTLGHGYESHSGFRDAFSRTFGSPPGRSRSGNGRPSALWTALLETPVGPMLAATGNAGLVLLEFSKGRQSVKEFAKAGGREGIAVVPGRHPHLDLLREELASYFVGARRDFTVPIAPRGTAFQQKVWAELRRIPHAATISYAELARRIGQPSAQRAVAGANNQNRIAILIPCHRVIGKDGSLTGYGGGLWRKRLLLELERNGGLPG